MTIIDRDTSGFSRASHQSQALCFGCLGVAGILGPIATHGYDSPLKVVLGWIAFGLGAVSFRETKKHWIEHGLAVENQGTEMVGGYEVPAYAGADLAGLDTTNPHVIRLLKIAAGISDTLAPLPAEFSFKDDDAAAGEMISYGLVSSQPGFFATEASMNRITAALATPFGTGWSIAFDSEKDIVTSSRKSSVPSLATPPIWPVMPTREAAAANFPKLAIDIGVGENGPVLIKPKDVPHREVVGATGGGKSVAVRAELMQYFSAGYRVFAVDGKGTDYSPFMRFSNVTAVSTNLHEHVLVIHMVWLMLKQRQRRSSDLSKRGDNSWRDTMTPILLILDEFASVRSNMKAAFTSKEMRLIERDMVDILKVGREFRVNVILATQDMKADTVPGDWQDMFKVVQSLGKPGPMVVRKAFPEQIRGEVNRLGGTISPKTPGRALVTVADDAGKVTAQLYQSYWSYSPAETISGNTPAVVRPNWEEFKREVSDKIPKLYPRMWAKMEYPAPIDQSGKDPYADDRDEGWVDLGKMSVADIHRLALINLQDPGTLEDITENVVHDPLAESYLGMEPLGGGGSEIADY